MITMLFTYLVKTYLATDVEQTIVSEWRVESLSTDIL